MNMKHSIQFPIAKSGDHVVEDAVAAILIEKDKRIKPLLPTVSCKELDALVAVNDRPTIAYYGSPSLVKGPGAKLSFLRHVHQANLIAFEREQHDFVAVYDMNCIKEKGFSHDENDWALVYYPANKEAKTRALIVRYP